MRVKRVLLRDGSVVLIRQVQSEDAPLLAAGFARLSAKSRRLRFLTDKSSLTRAELRYFTEVDHHDHEALGALNPVDGRGVGIARYIRDAKDPHGAEVAVVDDWQRQGLGTELLTQLADRGRQEGIRHFTALITGTLTNNKASTTSTTEIARPARPTQAPGHRRQAVHMLTQITVPIATAIQ